MSLPVALAQACTLILAPVPSAFGLQYYKAYSNGVKFARLTAGIFMYPAFELLFGVCCVALLYGWEF